MQRGCRIVYGVLPSFFGLELEDGHVPTLELLVYKTCTDSKL